MQVMLAARGGNDVSKLNPARAGAQPSNRRLRWSIALVAAIFLGLGVGSALEAQGSPSTIELSGYSYSADNFVFCIDRSCSMGWQGDLQAVKAELTDTLAQLTPAQNFSLVAFSSSTTVFSADLIPGSTGNILDAQAWLNSLSPDGSTCMADGVVQAVGIAAQGSGSNAVVVVADGVPNCPGVPETLAAVTAANVTMLPVHTMVVPGAGNDPGVISFLQNLASSNFGTFANMAFPPPPPFLRGDANGDGAVNIPDAARILGVGFGLSAEPICLSAADLNGDGQFIAIADAVYLLSYLFLPTVTEVPAPFPQCGSVISEMSCEISNCP